MRLSENRIQMLAREILKQAQDKQFIKVLSGENEAALEIARLMIKDLEFEDRIDEEVRREIQKMKKNIPEGSSEYQAVFRQLKQQIAQKYNYIL